MVTIQIKETGEIREVPRNEAFDLIDKGVATAFVKPVPEQKKEPLHYQTREMKPKGKRH